MCESGSVAPNESGQAAARQRSMKKPPDMLVVIKGAGDLASGVAARLHRCRFPVIMTELPNPLMVRRTVAFGEAVYENEAIVEGIRARRVEDVATAHRVLQENAIPVLVDPEARCLAELTPAVLVDAIMAKHNAGTSLADAPIVIAIGPGFTAGVDCHAVIETKRGHSLGRAIYAGSAEPDTGRPGSVGGKTGQRILRAPVTGIVEGLVAIGQPVTEGQVVATVRGHPVRAATTGVLRGLVRSGTRIAQGVKIGDVDPRADPAHCYLISDKALAIAGGVLEAILHLAPD
jgi:xanthine dehydrogenase accessory factor